MDLGWIKIHRQIIDWEWYDEPNTFRVFLHLLLKANHKPKKYRGITIETGQIMTGQDLLASELKLTRSKIRLALSNLKTTNEITINSSRKGTIIQIVNYKNYQITESKQPKDSQRITKEQPNDSQRTTTNKNVNNIKNEKNEINIEFDLFWDLYDKKISKVKCENKWSKLTDKERDDIIAYLPSYIKSTPDVKFRKNPETFFNNKSWLDELPKGSEVKASWSIDNY
jgi:uncharacterized protein YcfL